MVIFRVNVCSHVLLSSLKHLPKDLDACSNANCKTVRSYSCNDLILPRALFEVKTVSLPQ